MRVVEFVSIFMAHPLGQVRVIFFAPTRQESGPPSFLPDSPVNVLIVYPKKIDLSDLL